MFSKVLFGLEVMALIAAPFGYLMLREYRAEQFFKAGETALREGDWDKAYVYYQEAARRDNDAVKASVACRLTLCKDFGLGVAPAAQLQNCPWHDRMFSHCLAVCKVPAKQIFEGAKQGLAESGSTDLIVWVAAAYMNGYSTVSQPYEEATDWYRMAAVRGRVDAQRQLVTMAYERKWTPGLGELPSEWLLNVKDMLEARILLGERVAAGDESLAEHQEATDWLLAAAKQGNKQAKEKLQTKKALEHAFAKGAWKRKTDEETFRALLPYAEADIAAAQKLLADHYWYGWGVPQSREKAQGWYRRAAKNEDGYSQWWLDTHGK